MNGWVNNMSPKQEDGFKIPINQQVTGASMADQQREMLHKIHIRTMMNPDPDLLDLEPHISLQELIEHHITFNAEVFSDFYDDIEIQNQVSEKKNQLQSLDIKLMSDVSEIDQKIIANNSARSTILESINSVVNGIKNNL